VGGIQLVAHPFSQSNPLKLLGSSTTIKMDVIRLKTWLL
jgi:hypothetical protein